MFYLVSVPLVLVALVLVPLVSVALFFGTSSGFSGSGSFSSGFSGSDAGSLVLISLVDLFSLVRVLVFTLWF